MEGTTAGGSAAECLGKRLGDLKSPMDRGQRSSEGIKHFFCFCMHKNVRQNHSANSDPAQCSKETKRSQISACCSRINGGSHFQYMLRTWSFSFKLSLSDVQYTQLSPPRSTALSSWLLLTPLYFNIWFPLLCSLFCLFLLTASKTITFSPSFWHTHFFLLLIPCDFSSFIPLFQEQRPKWQPPYVSDLRIHVFTFQNDLQLYF